MRLRKILSVISGRLEHDENMRGLVRRAGIATGQAVFDLRSHVQI